MIIRTNTLKFILREFNSQNLPKIVEILGEPGIGKSSVISQISTFFNEHSLNTKSIIVKPAKLKSLFKLLLNTLKEAEYNIPESILSQTPKSKEEDLRLTLELIYLIRENEKELILLIFDDFHELIKEFQSDIKLIFNPKYMTGNYGLLIFSRPNYKADFPHYLMGFSKEQFNLYIDNIFSKKWRGNNTKVCDWMFQLTAGNPFYIKHFSEQLLISGLISENELTVSEIKSLKIPSSISIIIKNKLDFILKDSSVKELLQILSIFPSKVDKLKFSFIPSFNETLNNCIDENIIMELNGYIDLYHPLIKEYIFSTIDEKTKSKLISKALKKSTNLQTEELLHLLKELNNKTKLQEEEIINYAKELGEYNKYYLAIDYLSSIKNYKNNPEILSIMGDYWMSLTNIKKAGECFDILLNNKKFVKNRRYIGNAIFYLISTQKFDEAIKIIKYCLENESEISEKLRYFIHVSYIWLLVRKYDWDNIETSLKILKEDSVKSKFAKINYYKASLLLCSTYPQHFDIKKTFKDSVNYAIKEKLYNFAAQFCHTIMCYYIKNINEQGIEKYYNLVKLYSKQSFSLDVEKSTATFYSAHLVQKEKYLTAYKTFDNYGDLSDYNYIKSKDALILTKFNMLLNIGRFSIINEFIQKFSDDSEVLPMSRLVLYMEFVRYFILIDDFKNAQKYAELGIKLAIEFNILEKQKKYNLLEKASQKNFDSLTEKLNEKENSSLYSSVKFTCILAILLKSKKLNEKVFHLLDLIDDSFFKQFLLTLFYIKSAEMSKGLTILSKLEYGFDGQFLPYFQILYHEIEKSKLIRKEVKQKYKQLNSQISFILTPKNSKDKPKVNYKNLGFGFSRLIQNWYLCLIEGKEFDEMELDFFTNDFNKIENLKTALNIWGINIINPNTKQSSSTLYINLFGEVQIIYKNKNTQIKLHNYISKTQKLILCYLFLFMKESHQISLEKVLAIFYPDKAYSKSLNNLQIHISRINAIFKTINFKLISLKNNYLVINDSIKVVTDIMKFENLAKIGDENCINNNWVQARYNFEICLHLYQSELLVNFDEKLIDSLRSYYLEKYIEVINSLIAIYEELDLPQLKLELLQKIVIENPYIEEFQEYLNEMELKM